MKKLKASTFSPLEKKPSKPAMQKMRTNLELHEFNQRFADKNMGDIERMQNQEIWKYMP